MFLKRLLVFLYVIILFLFKMAEQSAPPLKKQRREGPETSSDDEEEESDQTKSKPFRVEKVSNIRNRKFNVEEIRFRAKFTEELHDERLLDATDDLQDMFAEILETIDNEGYLDEDRVRISINHEGLEVGISLWQNDLTFKIRCCRLHIFFFYFFLETSFYPLPTPTPRYGRRHNAKVGRIK